METALKIQFALFITCSLLFLAGCQSIASPAENTEIPATDFSPIPTLDQEEGIDMSDESPTVSPQAQIMVNLAKESLARKFKISEDKIHLFSVEPMVWPDAGLGCPQAGIVYAEVQTPGFQILFEADGKSFSYHTDNEKRVVLCRIHPTDEIFPTP